MGHYGSLWDNPPDDPPENQMDITIESLLQGARNARGLVVLIDVLRAFTTAAYVLNNGARKIIPVGRLEEAFRLKKSNQTTSLWASETAASPKASTTQAKPS